MARRDVAAQYTTISRLDQGEILDLLLYIFLIWFIVRKNMSISKIFRNRFDS